MLVDSDWRDCNGSKFIVGFMFRFSYVQSFLSQFTVFNNFLISIAGGNYYDAILRFIFYLMYCSDYMYAVGVFNDFKLGSHFF